MSNGPVSLSQRSDYPWIKGLIYGASGVGKTVLTCGSQQFNTFVFDVDDGVESGAAFRGDAQYGTKASRKENVITWRIGSRADFEAAYAWLMQNAAQFQLIVIDTATELQRILQGEICAKFKKTVPDQQCWGEILVMMENIARTFRHLQSHVVWLCHEVAYENAELARVQFRPSFAGDFKVQYAKHFALIARFCVMDQQVKDEATGAVATKYLRALNCNKDQVTEAKDRSTGLNKWEPPNLDLIIGKMVQAIQSKGVDVNNAASE